jgi:hypothetical protein
LNEIFVKLPATNLHGFPLEPLFGLLNHSFNGGIPSISGRVKCGLMGFSGPPWVMRTVCSKWAEDFLFSVMTVQPSSRMRTRGTQTLTIGSIAIVMQ